MQSLEELVLPSAAVLTDRPDYAPGQTALITATGFPAGETVRLKVAITDSPPGQSFSPWFVTDGGPGDLDGVADGTIHTSWMVTDQCLGATLLLTATGQASGLSAQWVFTDNAPVTTAVTATPVLANTPPTITANLTESGPASANIAAAEFFIDTVGANGTGTAMAPTDGAFDSKIENITRALTAAQFAALSQGTHTIYVHGEDVKGNWGLVASATFTKDTVAPTVNLTALPPVVPPATALTISGTATDSGSGVAGVQVTVTDAGGTVLASGVTTNTGTNFSTWSFTYTPALDGAETVTAKATDLAGNATTTAPVGFRVGAGIDASGNLLVYGYPSGDTILVDATNPAAATVTIDGTLFGPFAIPAGGHVVVDAFEGGNTITVLGGVAADITSGAGNDMITAGTGNSTIHAGGGNDTIVLNGNAAATMTVDGGSGANTVVVNTGGGADAVTVNNNQVQVAGGATTSYSNIQTLTANTGAGADAVTVNAFGAGLPGQINVNTGGDDDQVTVNLGTGVATNIAVDGGGQTAGDSVTVNGTAGADTIALNGSTLTSGPTVVGLAGVENLAIATAGGGDSITVAGTTLTGALTLTDGDGAGTLTLGGVSAGQLSAMVGSMTLSGPITTTGSQSYSGAITWMATASISAGGSIVVTAVGPLTVAGAVSSTAGGLTLTASGSTLTVNATTINAGGGNIVLVAATVTFDNAATVQASGTVQVTAATVHLNGVNLGTNNLVFNSDNASVDLNGADFGSLTNQGTATTINLSGADFSSLTNSASATMINLNGANFDSLTNTGSGAQITIAASGAQFGSLTNTGTNVQISLAGANFDSLTNAGTGTVINLTGAQFDSLTNSASGTTISLNGAQFDSLVNAASATTINLNGANFDSLTNTGTTAQISLNGANFDSLVNSATSATINITGATFQLLVNGDAAQVAQIAANGADFSTLTDTAGHSFISLNGANFDTLVNAGSNTTIALNGADFDSLINGGGATGTSISINVNGANFDSLYNYGSSTSINITGAGFSTPSNGIVQINLNNANFNSLINAGSATTINVTGATFDSLVSTATGTTINLNGANFDTLVSAGTATTISIAGADFDTLQSSGSSTSINITGVDFESLVNSGGTTAVTVTASSFQYVQNDGDSAVLALANTGAGSSTVANNGNGVNVTYAGGPGADVFINDARGDTSHGNNVALNANLGTGNDRFVIGGTGVTGTLAGGTGDHTYLFAAGLTGDLTIQQPATTDTDTLDFSNLTTGPVNIDLAVTTKQSVAPSLSLTLSSATGISNVVGTQFGDTIRGNSRDNLLLGADLPDDRIGTGPGWNGRTQTVFLDFDSKTQPADHQYTTAERYAIQARLEADYHGPTATSDPSTWWFHVAFTQTKPAGVQNVDYVTVYFNQPRTGGSEGSPGVGGDSSEIDFGNRSFGGWASVDVKTTDPVTHVATTLIGGPGQPPEYNSGNTSDQSWQNDNWVRASSWIAAHELGHLMGLRHADSFGPIGYGIHTPPGTNGFFISPAYNGLTGAFETDSHLIATPALTGFTLNDLVGDTFFGEREAVKLAYSQEAPVTPDGKLLMAEQTTAHGSLTSAGSQLLTLSSLDVPDTLTRGLNSIKQFQVGGVDVLGSIGTVGEKDVYRINGRKGDLLNIQVMSEALARYAGNAIDAVLTVYDSSGNVVASSDDEFEDHDPSIIDLRLPTDGTYYLQVTTSGTDAHDGLNPTGKYELFAYRFCTANPTDGNDTLEGRGGNNILAGGMGNDTYVFNGVNLGGNVIQEDVRYEAQNGTMGSRDARDKLDFSGFGAPITLNMGQTGPQVVSPGNLILQLSSALGIEDVVLPRSFNATVTGNARDDTFVWANRPTGYSGTVTDTITGGAGTDTVDYSALTAGVSVNLGSRGSQTVGGGYVLTLPAEDMENVAGSATGANSLTGNSLNGLLIGGAGNDKIVGGSGNEILIGNAGDDMLTGGSGNDLLIGGTGGDRLVASNGNNILIAGSTAYDFLGFDPAKAQILTGILAEWANSAETYDTRYAAIAGQAGSGHLNGGYFLNTSTVFSDTSVDTLTSSSGNNWYFVDNTANDNTPADIITGTTKKNPYFTYI